MCECVRRVWSVGEEGVYGECVRRVREDEGEKRVGWWDGDCVGR